MARLLVVKRGLIGGTIDIGPAIVLAITSRLLGIDFRGTSTVSMATAWTILILPRIVALVTVYASTRPRPRPTRR